MTITRRTVIGSQPDPDEGRWAKPQQLVCPVCREPARGEQPAYWRMADGPVPAWSHPNREPLCPVMTDDGTRPALPVPRTRRERLANPETKRLRSAIRPDPAPPREQRGLDRT